MSRLSITSRSTFFFLGQDFSVEIYLRRDIYRDRRDKSRLSRFLDIIKTFLRLQAQKSRQIEKSWSRTMIKLTNSWSRSRQTVEICRQISWSQTRLLGLERGVKTKPRFLDLDRWDKLFEIFSTVNTYFLPVSRSRVLMERPHPDKSRPPSLQVFLIGF